MGPVGRVRAGAGQGWGWLGLGAAAAWQRRRCRRGRLACPSGGPGRSRLLRSLRCHASAAAVPPCPARLRSAAFAVRPARRRLARSRLHLVWLGVIHWISAAQHRLAELAPPWRIASVRCATRRAREGTAQERQRKERKSRLRQRRGTKGSESAAPTATALSLRSRPSPRTKRRVDANEAPCRREMRNGAEPRWTPPRVFPFSRTGVEAVRENLPRRGHQRPAARLCQSTGTKSSWPT
jgi:hypothetical protein